MATDQQLTKIYYNPNHPASFSNSKKLGLACKKKIRKKDIDTWLAKQECYTIHKQRRKKFPRKNYVIDNIDDLWEMDLMVFENDLLKSANGGVCYILGKIPKNGLTNNDNNNILYFSGHRCVQQICLACSYEK